MPLPPRSGPSCPERTVTPERIPALIIGGGVIGCAVFWELSRRGIVALLVEANLDVGEGTSKANSAIVHTGFDARPETAEAHHLRRAAALWPQVIDELGVPFLRTGALMVARTPEEEERLAGQIMTNAASLGVRTHLVRRRALRDIAPYITDEARAALLIPDEGVIDPFWLTRAYAEAAVAGGGMVSLGSRVLSLHLRADGVVVGLDDGRSILAEEVFDCAGLRADEVAALAGDPSFRLRPRKGQFLVSEETFGVDRIVLPIPGPLGKGMLVTPIVFGGLLLGPTAEDVESKEDLGTDPVAAERILANCARLVPAVAETRPIRQFAGLRHVPDRGDFILGPSRASDRLWLVAGIRSTGISVSPSVARSTVEQAMAVRGWRAAEPPRTIVIPPLAIADPPGEVVCLCRGVTRGEVLSALQRPLPPTTLDGVKRRSGALLGDCQGNLCAVGILRIVAEARGVPPTAVERHRQGSWVVASAPPEPAAGPHLPDAPRTRAEARTLDTPSTLPFHDTEGEDNIDAVIVGAGHAGLGAALALANAGLRPLILERRGDLWGTDSPWRWVPSPAGWDLFRIRQVLEDRPLLCETASTVVALLADQGGWRVQVHRSTGSREVRAPAVVLATGGFVEPGEHRRLAGPRPAGVVTADFVLSALAAGLLPGRRAVVVGAGPLANRLVAALQQTGCAVVAHLDRDTVRQVQGSTRLEAVVTDNGTIAADTLVFADRLLPQTFLLRSLGVVDQRPGAVAPADEFGRLPALGLWAAGTCVRPRPDHAGAFEDGWRVGERLAAAMGTRLAAGRGASTANSGASPLPTEDQTP